MGIKDTYKEKGALNMLGSFTSSVSFIPCFQITCTAYRSSSRRSNEGKVPYKKSFLVFFLTPLRGRETDRECVQQVSPGPSIQKSQVPAWKHCHAGWQSPWLTQDSPRLSTESLTSQERLQSQAPLEVSHPNATAPYSDQSYNLLYTPEEKTYTSILWTF